MDPRPDLLRELEQAIERAQQALARLREAMASPELFMRGIPDGPVVQHVTLRQIAAAVDREVTTVKKRLMTDGAPRPVHQPRGRASVWLWSEVQPWLVRRWGDHAPEIYPGLSWF